MLESTPLYGGNADYLEGLYEQYLSDPGSVPAQWRTYFDGLGPRPAAEQAHGPVVAGIAARAQQPPLAAAPAAGGRSGRGQASRRVAAGADLVQPRSPGRPARPTGPDESVPGPRCWT